MAYNVEHQRDVLVRLILPPVCYMFMVSLIERQRFFDQELVIHPKRGLVCCSAQSFDPLVEQHTDPDNCASHLSVFGHASWNWWRTLLMVAQPPAKRRATVVVRNPVVLIKGSRLRQKTPQVATVRRHRFGYNYDYDVDLLDLGGGALEVSMNDILQGEALKEATKLAYAEIHAKFGSVEEQEKNTTPPSSEE